MLKAMKQIGYGVLLILDGIVGILFCWFPAVDAVKDALVGDISFRDAFRRNMRIWWNCLIS